MVWVPYDRHAGCIRYIRQHQHGSQPTRFLAGAWRGHPLFAPRDLNTDRDGGRHRGTADAQSTWLTPHSNKGFLPATLDEYLTLLDTLGRMLRQGKRGAIPSNAVPLLERLNVETSHWLESLWSLFQNDRLAARRHMVAGHG